MANCWMNCNGGIRITLSGSICRKEQAACTGLSETVGGFNGKSFREDRLLGNSIAQIFETLSHGVSRV